MIEMRDELFEGYQCLRLKNQQISIWITKDVGPRIIGLSLAGGDNLMVVLPDAKIPVESGEDYWLRGGHRLWYGPERPETTYIADDQPLEIHSLQDGVKVYQPMDDATGIQKILHISLDNDSAEVNIEHELLNKGSKPFQLAPWAVTMLRPGGEAVLPLQVEQDDPNGLWPNRQLAFWPYTDIRSGYLELANRAAVVKATMTTDALKIGAPNPIGWLAYRFQNTLFIKRSDYHPDREYLDRQSSSQIYCNPSVIELETLGPVVNLAPGKSTLHHETWQVYHEGDWPEEILDLYKEILVS